MRHSIFLRTDAGTLYRTEKSRSFVNPRHIFLVEVITGMLQRAGAQPTQTAIITPYKGQIPRPFSVTDHVALRLHDFLNSDPAILNTVEGNHLRSLHAARLALERLKLPEASDEDHTLLYKNFDRQWQGTREFFIKFRAKGIITTSATALQPLLRTFKPQCVIFDEASQLLEASTVAVIGKFFERISKILGEVNQRQPFVWEGGRNEFAEGMRRSLMERLEMTGFPLLRLTEQYRMHPHSAETVSRQFYKSSLINAPSTNYRPDYDIWERFIRTKTTCTSMRHSVFLHTNTQTLYRTKTTRSYQNPRHLVLVKQLVNSLRECGAMPDQIAVLSPYRGQLRMLQAIDLPAVHLVTVDSCQGKEYPFVILDLVNPAGDQYSLGFMAEPRRACVALSRAQSGMIMIGHQEMGQDQYRRSRSRMWNGVIQDHKAKGGFFRQDVRAKDVQDLCHDLEIPGRFCDRPHALRHTPLNLSAHRSRCHKMATIDSCQGKEYPFVILDLVNPGMG